METNKHIQYMEKMLPAAFFAAIVVFAVWPRACWCRCRSCLLPNCSSRRWSSVCCFNAKVARPCRAFTGLLAECRFDGYGIWRCAHFARSCRASDGLLAEHLAPLWCRFAGQGNWRSAHCANFDGLSHVFRVVQNTGTVASVTRRMRDEFVVVSLGQLRFDRILSARVGFGSPCRLCLERTVPVTVLPNPDFIWYMTCLLFLSIAWEWLHVASNIQGVMLKPSRLCSWQLMNKGEAMLEACR
ncbi:hypothetical protein BDV95DRAFT_204007 [Massariosphaeria phaeospora]|uniref:Uncharacterized protein n=1 Tax=Massariosphaeria phaeospora TaxID=100035 RepID=A0A7C8M8K4_9PLEO|nr:hypothetical protein BDV95DRAFT_204007 [Massariosphaeria phaeospora]